MDHRGVTGADGCSGTKSTSDAFVLPPIFQNPEADLIIKSSDNIEFRVWKGILIEGSVVFKDMFANPPSAQSAAEPVPWPEPAKVICRLLMFMYPIPKSSLDSLDEIFAIIRAADKWQIDVAVSYLKDILLSKRFTSNKTEAFREETAKLASEIDPCGLAVRDQLTHMTALDMLRLVKLRSDPSKPFDHHFDDAAESVPPAGIHPIIVPPVFRDPEADMTILSSDGVEYCVFKLYLSHSSSKFRDMIRQLNTHGTGTASARPTLPLPLPAATIETLLYYIYPLPKPHDRMLTMDHLMACLRAAATWDIGVALEALRKELTAPGRMRSHPLRIYGFASSMAFKEETAKSKARALLFDPLKHTVKKDFTDMTAHYIQSPPTRYSFTSDTL
ncbi:hypothetical protein CALVIDRAFT_565967 [Calocera viscosa TUFC12733]|uniref:BTB domain-containing protein n=1 Tax=Calocera viscosa (strain TUFC12733) TaxID=1330018 RepID=A0A167JWE5_CALVF|nr:hypothetical protein CALVIDRAFT_565967 [Calocera viscosa TUFC12733]